MSNGRQPPDIALQAALALELNEQQNAYQSATDFLANLPPFVNNPYPDLGVLVIQNFALALAGAAGDTDTFHTDAPIDWYHVYIATNSGTPDFGVCLGSQYNIADELRLLSTFTRRLTFPARMNDISLRNYSANANTITVIAYSNHYRGLETQA